MSTEPVSAAATPEPEAGQAFARTYLAELQERVQRSAVLGSISLKKGSATIYHEPTAGRFTLVEQLPAAEAPLLFDCVPRAQWGRTVMLFGHATQAGGYTPMGHATLDGNTLKIKLSSGHYYRLDVDASQAMLQPFAAPPAAAGESGKDGAQEGGKDGAREAREPRARQDKRAQQPNKKHNNGSTNVRSMERPPQPDAAQAEPARARDDEDENEDLTEEDLRRLRGEIPLNRSAKKKWKR